MTRRSVSSCLTVAVTSLAVVCVACSDGTGPVQPRRLELVAGDTQQSRPGEELPIPLRVRVFGSDDRPFAGAPVQWAVIGGTATINPAQSTTNGSGNAETRVTMGSSVGPVTVRASVPGTEPISFSSVALPSCEWWAWPLIAPGSTISGTLRPHDCEVEGRFHDLFPLNLPTQQALSISLRSTSFDPEVQFYSFAPWFYFVNDSVNATREARFKAILPASEAIGTGGAYGIAATSMEAGATGPFELTVVPTSGSAESCERVFVMLGITTSQNLASTDCSGPSGRYEDEFRFVILRGQRVRVTETLTQFAPLLRIVRAGQVVAQTDGSGSGTAVVIYTAEADDLYAIRASSVGAQQIGTYSLSVGLDVASNPRIGNARTDDLPRLQTTRRAQSSARSGWARVNASQR